MIGKLRLGIVLRGERLGVVALAGHRVREAFALDLEDNPGAMLRGELDARGLKAKKAALGLQRSPVTVKALELPPAVGGSLSQMVAFELERHLPFPPEEAIFDFVSLPAAAGAELRRVLLVACERRTVDRALRLMEEARLAPTCLTVACHDLTALLGARPEKPTVWIHRVGEEAEVVFLERRRLSLSRSMPVASEADLLREIGKSLMHLGWEEVDALWVSGDQAEELLISTEFSRLGADPEPPPLSRRARAAVASLGAGADGLMLLALATTLAPRRRPLSLLPASMRARQVTWGELVTAASVALAALLGIALLFAQGYQSEHHLARLNQAIRALDPEVRAVERLVSDVEAMRRILTTVRAVEDAALHPLPFLRELTELMPNEAWLTTLSLDTKGAEMTGQAVAANQLIPLLEGSPSLERVEFVSPVTRGRQKEQFRIRASWETLPGPATPRGAPPRGARTP